MHLSPNIHIDLLVFSLVIWVNLPFKDINIFYEHKLCRKQTFQISQTIFFFWILGSTEHVHPSWSQLPSCSHAIIFPPCRDGRKKANWNYYHDFNLGFCRTCCIIHGLHSVFVTKMHSFFRPSVAFFFLLTHCRKYLHELHICWMRDNRSQLVGFTQLNLPLLQVNYNKTQQALKSVSYSNFRGQSVNIMQLI